MCFIGSPQFGVRTLQSVKDPIQPRRMEVRKRYFIFQIPLYGRCFCRRSASNLQSPNSKWSDLLSSHILGELAYSTFEDNLEFASRQIGIKLPGGAGEGDLSCYSMPLLRSLDWLASPILSTLTSTQATKQRCGMPSMSLTSSMILPEGLSDGVSKTNSTTPWGHGQSTGLLSLLQDEPWSSSNPSNWLVRGTGASGQIRYTTLVDVTGQLPVEDTEAMKSRLACLYFSCFLSDKSITEACETLLELYQAERSLPETGTYDPVVTRTETSKPSKQLIMKQLP